jgi:hypothetical protein
MYGLNQQSMTFTQVNTPNPNGGYGQYGYGGYGQYGGGYGQYGGGYGGYNQVTVMRVCDSAEPCPAGQTCRSPIGGQVNGVGLCYF